MHVFDVLTLNLVNSGNVLCAEVCLYTCKKTYATLPCTRFIIATFADRVHDSVISVRIISYERAWLAVTELTALAKLCHVATKHLKK